MEKVIEIDGRPFKITSGGKLYSLDHTTIAKDGKVMRYKGRELKAQTLPRGYQEVQLTSSAGRPIHLKIHRLVAENFLPPVPGKTFVNHINEDPADNRVENLEWTDQKGNVMRSYERHPERSHPRVITGRSLSDGSVVTFNSARAAARAINGSQGSISTAARGESRQAYGYIWTYL